MASPLDDLEEEPLPPPPPDDEDEQEVRDEAEEEEAPMMQAGYAYAPTAPYYIPPAADPSSSYHNNNNMFMYPVIASPGFLWGAQPVTTPTATTGWAGGDSGCSNHQPEPHWMSYHQPPQQQHPFLPLLPPPHNKKTGLGLQRKQKKRKKEWNVLDLENDPRILDTAWKHLIEESAQPRPDFCCPVLLDDIPEALYLAVAQFQFCGVTADDRIGKYKHRELGYVGMCCRHCGGQPGFGRYFPGSYDSFLNGTNSDGIVQHILECNACPEAIRTTVKALHEQAPDPTTLRPRYGSRKRFFSYVWTKLRQHELILTESSSSSLMMDGPAAAASSTEGTPAEDHQQRIQKCLEQSEIVNLSDRHLISDVTLVALSQMKICHVTEEDRVGRCKDHVLGYPGLCCTHCSGGRGGGGKPGYGRYFPTSLRSLAQVDSCQQMVRHVATKCGSVPDHVRILLEELQRAEQQQQQQQPQGSDDQKNNKNHGRIKYGSRMMFFKRVWGRLHGHDDAGLVGESSNDGGAAAADLDWETLLGGSDVVVQMEDRGLIPDSQLLAIAQMKPCQLTEADRVGWFKDRDLGFGGLTCRACGGRPSFGRYFPNSIRSFAQTTSSQTIVSHVTMYCPTMPSDIREWVIKLQKMESSQESSTVNESTYGSRKVFFGRVWKRMHGVEEKDMIEEEQHVVVSPDVGSSVPPPSEDDALVGEGEPITVADERPEPKRQKLQEI